MCLIPFHVQYSPEGVSFIVCFSYVVLRRPLLEQGMKWMSSKRGRVRSDRGGSSAFIR